MSGNPIKALLEKYLKGETTTDENVLIERWIDENGASGSDWHTMDRSQKDQWLSGTFHDIKASINKEAKVIALPQRKPVFWRSIAAAAALLIISFTLYMQWLAQLHPVHLNTLSVPANQKKQIILPDGSQLWVNAGSTLKYPQAFRGKTREVYLSGEAYFDIKHNTIRPFIIHTGGLITTVLGTAFDIKEDKIKHTIEVTVTRGKVSVANGNRLLGVLTRNQQISFNTSKSESVKQTVNAALITAWQQSEFQFDDVSFEEAALQLQKHFNVKISFAKENLKACRFTGTSLNGEKLDKILKVICAFNNATYRTQTDGSILIDGPGCN